MPLGCLAALFGKTEKTTQTAETVNTPGRMPLPERFPVAPKRYFFSPDENVFFRSVEESLSGSPYRVFPNVRLGDVLRITDQKEYASVRGRLKDKHVDFLIVDTSKDFQPVLAIELDGRSHQREPQQHRDAVKDLLFRSAGLPLYRLESRKYQPHEIAEIMKAAAT